MPRLLIIALHLSALAGCTKISNNINDVELNCGDASDSVNFRYVKLFNSFGVLKDSEGLRVQNELGQDFSHVLTSRGCLKIPKDLDEKLIVIRPSANEGLAFFSNRLEFGLIQPLLFKSFRYQSLTSSCSTDLATNANAMPWPVDFTGVATDSYDWRLSIKKQNEIVLDVQRNAVEDLNRERIDLSSLEDGTYKLSVEARQLFSQDKVESRFDCNLIVDRLSPIVSIDRELIRIIDEDETYLQASPGEAIKIQTIGSQSVDAIYSCLRPEKSSVDSCKFDQVTAGYITAPQKGSWYLRLYAKDQAGNIGPITERKLQIFDGNLVSTILSFINQSSLAQKAGNSIFSLVLAVKAYEKMLSVGSKAELGGVLSSVRKSILESSAVAVEELVIRIDQFAKFEGRAVAEKNSQPIFLQANATTLEGMLLNGKKDFSLDIAKALNLPPHTLGYRYCQESQEIIAAGASTVAIFKYDSMLASIPIPEAMRTTIGSVTSDCRYVFLSVTNAEGKQRKVVLNLHTHEFLNAPGNALDVVGLLDVGEPNKLILKGNDNWHFLYDFVSRTTIELADILAMTKIDQIKKSADGTTAVLTSEQIFSIFDKAGKAVLKIENVSSFYPGALSSEYIVIRYGYAAEIYSSAGIKKSYISVGAPNWTYMSASTEFLVGMSAGSNVVKIWTRAGNFFDEIYNKGDAIQNVYLSADGYLHVGSSQFNKVYRLNTGFSKKHMPQYQVALGLQFTSDGRNILYKDQRGEFVDMEHAASNRLINWNIETDERQTYDLPQVPFSSSIQYPGYGFQTRDLRYFTHDGQALLASTVKRGSVAIFKADDLSSAIEEYYFGPQWLLDVAVDPSGNRIAAASQGGSVYLVDRKSKIQGQVRLDEIYTEFFDEYPVNLTFDKSGQFIFVTDLNRNLVKYSIALDTVSNSFILTAVAKMSAAGDRVVLSPKGDQLALVGSGIKLKILDNNLNLLKEFELSNTTANFVQSVTYSPDGSKVYAGLYGGIWIEVDLKSGQMLNVRFSSSETGIFNLVVSPQGDRLAFMGGGFVQVADLNVDRVYQNICSWLRPRLPYIPDLSDDDRNLCQSQSAP